MNAQNSRQFRSASGFPRPNLFALPVSPLITSCSFFTVWSSAIVVVVVSVSCGSALIDALTSCDASSWVRLVAVGATRLLLAGGARAAAVLPLPRSLATMPAPTRRATGAASHEADDALAAGAALAAADPRVEQAVICTPDKDLAQCVTTDGRVVQLDRRRDVVYDHAGVVDKFGVPPASIPDYLGVVGDTADGFPGLAGWGAKSAAAVLSRYGHVEEIPTDATDWDVEVRGAAKLAATLREHRDDALLFRRIATVALDAPISDSVDDLRWRGPQPGFDARCDDLGADRHRARAHRLWTEFGVED